MNFVYSGYFIYLLAIVIPLIFLIFKKPKVDIKRFSAFIFLKKASQKNKHFINIKDLILFLLRSLIIAVLVLVVASPILKKFFLASDSQAVIVVDNSISMKNSYTEEELIEKIFEFRNSLKENMNVERFKYVFLENGTYVIKNNISDIEFVDYSFNLEKIKEFIFMRFDEKYSFFVLTDCQKNVFTDYRENERINIVNIHRTIKDNVFIKEINTPEYVFSEKSNRINITLTNTSNSLISGKIAIYKEDEIIDFKKINIQPKSNHSIGFDVFVNEGINVYKIMYEGDEFKEDNIRYFAVNGQNRINILYTGESFNLFLKKAFTSSENLSPFIFSSLLNGNLENADIVLINDLSRIEEEIDILNSIIEAGKTVIVIPDKDTEIEVFKNLSTIIPCEIVNKIGGNKKINNSLYIKNINFFKNYMLRDYNESDVLMYFDDRTPALIKKDIGDSKIYFYNMILEKEYTNFIFSPYFVYYWYDTFLYNKKAISNIINKNIPVNLNIIDSTFSKKLYYEPGVVMDKDYVYILNIPLEESEIERIDKFKNDRFSIEKFKSSLSIGKYLALLLLLLLGVEFYLSEKWM